MNKIFENLPWCKELLSQYPLWLVDVGALDGLKKPWDRAGFIKTLGFEPQAVDVDSEAARRTLGDNRIIIEDSALFDHKGHATLFVTSREDSSSLYEPNAAVINEFAFSSKLKVEKTLEVRTSTLDTAVLEHSISFIDFLKLDTQGSEGTILEHSEKTLEKSVFGIEVEVNFIERYRSQQFFRDIDAKLSRCGFEIFDLERRYGKRAGKVEIGGPKGQMTHGTALYFRRMQTILQLISNFDLQKKRAYILHYLVALALYGYYDVALRSIEESGSAFTETERNDLVSGLKLEASYYERKFFKKGSHKLFKLLSKLAALLKPYPAFGVSGDQGLGNTS